MMNMGNFPAIGAFFGRGWFLIPLAVCIGVIVFRTLSSRRSNGLRGGKSKDLIAPDGSIENKILQLALKHDGSLTITDVVMGTGLSIKKAEKVLNEMVDGYRVSMEVKDSGIITYEFAEIVDRLSDAGAKNSDDNEI